MDWEQIKKDFIREWFIRNDDMLKSEIVNWFKNRIESDISVSNRISPLTEEEKNEFYTTNVTADIKANYGK